MGQPAIAVGWSVLILGEVVRPAQIPGMILVLVGLAMFTVVSQRRARLAENAVLAQSAADPLRLEPGD